MRLGPELCHDPEQAQRLEWLETDGLGSYASSTVSVIRTRRYHGLLIAESRPDHGRRLLCAELETTVFVSGQRFPLNAHQYADTIHPAGYLYLEEFRLDPWPVWRYRIQEVLLKREVVMLHGLRTTLVSYTLLEAPSAVPLEVRPLLAGRDLHSTAIENWSFRRQSRTSRHRLQMAPYGAGSELALSFPGGRDEGDGFWYYSFVYLRDRERGLDDHEDLFSPGLIQYTLHPGEQAVLALGPAPLDQNQLELALDAERERRATLVVPDAPNDFSAALSRAADHYLVSDAAGPLVLAGYPWFEPRVRDTLLCIPGLALARNRLDLAAALLKSASQRLSAGLENWVYGVDEPLWLAPAAEDYLAAGGDPQVVCDDILPTLEQVTEAYRAGHCPGVAVAADGLVAHGGLDRPLTWMNAALSGWAVTPREGKAIEVNALWYAVQRLLERFDRGTGVAGEIRAQFEARYWSPELGYLFDAIDTPFGTDGSLRPNQVLALSVAPELVSTEVARAVVAKVEQELLTPFGLRTLAPWNLNYHGRYRGGPSERDQAYHQGSVWPWLLAPYARLLLRLEPDALVRVGGLTAAFPAELETGCLGQIPELYDGDAPHAAGGCPAQAVSTAALLEIGWLARGGQHRGRTQPA